MKLLLVRRFSFLLLHLLILSTAVDPESDKEIQAVIRREFASCTIFVIAHRLNTIMDCDKIIVMDKGQVAEFDSPMKLLEDRNSIFYSLANEAGLVRGSASGSGTPRNGSMTPRNGSMTPKPKY